ncbi:MAG: molecular chaperone TorD family protein [Pseudomonadota bacterium]|nr:molecular chaperone TorD family protein [Pseudomonadota bacterium]
MTAEPGAEAESATEAPPSLSQFREAVAEDLRQLAALHDREPDRELIHALHAARFPENMGLQLASEAGIAACRRVAEGLALLPDPPDQEIVDWLAVDYADIYLSHALRASPFESVWLDEDQLLNQQPMFEIRKWYEHYGVATQNWRQRSDDHITIQLQFLALLLLPAPDEEESEAETRLADAARFMDEHLLRWLPDFALRVSERCGTVYFAGVALLSDAYLDQLRDHLAALLDQPRPSRKEIDERLAPKNEKGSEEIMCNQSPGAAPSW